MDNISCDKIFMAVTIDNNIKDLVLHDTTCLKQIVLFGLLDSINLFPVTVKIKDHDLIKIMGSLHFLEKQY